ncbi:MAG: hypothetical protein AUI97_05360 [Crenarchaeota archaeon 13_1_40CM_3_52_17]|nr:MAG: hypothetical protein AUI97_05360 [Crenarchaeota archaeon 13_1_40CM_3_52_17]
MEKKNWLNSAGVVVPLIRGAHIQWAPGIVERSADQPPVLCPWIVAPVGQDEGIMEVRHTN